MSDRLSPKLPPRPTNGMGGPGSPQDVPPNAHPAGTLPIDPATLPNAIRNELEAPDPVALDTAAASATSSAPTCWSACTAATNGMARGSRRLSD